MKQVFLQYLLITLGALFLTKSTSTLTRRGQSFPSSVSSARLGSLHVPLLLTCTVFEHRTYRVQSHRHSHQAIQVVTLFLQPTLSIYLSVLLFFFVFTSFRNIFCRHLIINVWFPRSSTRQFSGHLPAEIETSYPVFFIFCVGHE